MTLPGTLLTAADNSDLALFICAVCEHCRHMKHCSILVYAGMYGGANEWRTIGDSPVCLRQEAPL